jgi:branched-chain amino acid transport system ATP-binding protein
MTAILSVRGLGKSFGSVAAARDITLDVPDRQTVGIIGANGAGKTTFINMVTGHVRPSSGTIRFADRDITSLPSREIVRRGVSRSFQVAQIFPSLTVFENMCTAAAIAARGDGLLAGLAPLHRKEIHTEATAALELFGISRHRNIPAAALPQGVRKLLDIAMATAGSPRLLLLDEPTSGIAIADKFGIMEAVMGALQSRRLTVLFVEHDMEMVARFAERLLVFHDGTVITDGAPAETLSDPQVQAFVSGTERRHA